MKITSSFSGIYTIIFSCFVFANKVSAYEFELDGQMKFLGPPVKIPTNSEMHVYVRDCQWRVVQLTDYPPSSVVPVPSKYREEISQDAAGTYSLICIETNSLPSGSKKNDSLQPIRNSWLAQLYADFPNHVLSPQMMVLFYAFASSCYLNSVTNDLLDPIKLQGDDLDRGERKVIGQVWRHAPSGLPEKIEFHTFSGTLTNATFTASAFTNVNGIEIPLKVSLVRYSMRNSADRNVLCAYEFQVTDIRPECSVTIFRPDLPTTALLDDYRFSHSTNSAAPPISYVYPTNGWPTLEESKLQPDYKRTQWDWNRIVKAPPGIQTNSGLGILRFRPQMNTD